MSDHAIHLGARPATIVHHGLRTGPILNADRVWMVTFGLLAFFALGTTWMMTQNSIELTARVRAMDACIVNGQNAYFAQDYGATLAWTVEARKARVTGVCRDSGQALAYLNGK